MLNKILFILLLLTTLNPLPLISSEAAKYSIVSDKISTPILSPSFSQRKTLKIQLQNGLYAYLISDPKIDLSAAALTVNAGSWQDPKEFPGLAHFLEHMLFLGTKKYPQESSYDAFVKKHGGATNAFTAATYTTFGFEVNHDVLDETLDRFSEFFKEPLFLQSGAYRELNAVNQEYLRNTENDDVRQFFVIKNAYSKDHPDHNFNYGNQETLEKVSTKELKEWFSKHYSANLMKLIVFSNKPIEEIRELVIKNFSDIPNRNLAAPIFTMPIKDSESPTKIAYIAPLKEVRKVTLTWELPQKFTKMMDEKPEELVCLALGHEGKSSLLALLKKEELAEGISCDTYQRGNYETFIVDIQLTEKGVREVNTVIERVFQAIHYLQDKGIPRYLFDEDRAVGLIKFQYPTRENPFQSALNHADQMSMEDLSSYPEKTLIIQKYDGDILKEYLSQLTPRNAFITVVAKPELTRIKPDSVEKWMNVSYALRTVPEEQIKAWESIKAHPSIALPKPNFLIPKNTQLIEPTKEATSIIPQPKILIDTPKGKLFYFQDDRYFVPQASLRFALFSSEVNASDPQKVVLTEMFLTSLKESLKEVSADALGAGFELTFERKDQVIIISINGYSDTASSLMKEITSRLKTSLPSLEEFNLYKDRLIKDYQNEARSSTYELAIDLFKKIIFEGYVDVLEKIKMAKTLSYDDFKAFYKDLFKETYIQAIIYGNMQEHIALDIYNDLEKTLKSRTYPEELRRSIKVGQMPNENGPYALSQKVKTLGNVAFLALEYETYSLKERASQQILSQLIEQPFFAELRTRQQTGYLVFHTNEDIEKHLFLLFLSESYLYAPQDLIARFELFLENYLNHLLQDPLAKTNFETARTSIEMALTHSQRSMKDMGDTLLNLALKSNGDFHWLDKRIKALNELTYEEFLDSVKKVIGKTNKMRLALLLEGVIPNNDAFKYTKAKNVSWLKDQMLYLTKEEFMNKLKKTSTLSDK